MKEYDWIKNYDGDEDAKKLVGKFFVFQDKQCKVEKDTDGNFFIERDDVDNENREFHACLKKIIFKKDGKIDVEMCIDNKHYTLNITEYKIIQPQESFLQEKNIEQPFNWKSLIQGDLTENNVLNFLNSSQDLTKLNELKNKIINQLAMTLDTELNKKLNKKTRMSATNQNFNKNESVNDGNNEKTNNINIIPKFIVNNNNLDIATNANISSSTNKTSMVIDHLKAEIKQTLEEFMSDITVEQQEPYKPNIVIKNKNNNKITEINISPNNTRPCACNDVKFNIFINGKKYSISYGIVILPFVQNGYTGSKVCKDFLNDVNDYLQDENNKKIFVEQTAGYVKRQIEKGKQINENNEEQNNNIINQKALNIIDKNKELRHENNNVVTDKQKNQNENITNNAEDKKHTAVNTNKNNENDTYHNEDHYIARKIRNCLSTIDCCDCLSLDTGSSIYWRKDNSHFIFE